MAGGGFGVGLTEGLVNGWSQQQEQKSQLEMTQKKEQIDNYLTLARASDIPDDKRQWALEQATTLMQGKKPGSSGGNKAPNGIIQRLGKMLGMAHGNGQPQQGGQAQPQGQPMSEQIPGGQGTSAAPQLPQGTPGQRPTLATPEGAQPGGGAGEGNVQPSYADQLQARLAAAQKSGNSFAVQRAQKALDDFEQKQELETGRAESAAEVARIRADSVRDKAEADAQHRKELQELKDSDSKTKAEDIEKLRAQYKKESDERTEQFKKEMEAVTAKAREDLKRTAPGKNGGTDRSSAQQKKLSDQIENWHQQQYAALDKQLADMQARQTVPAARIAQLRKTRATEIERQYADKVKRAGGSLGDADRVKVVSKDGTAGTVPRAQLADALASGYSQVQ